MPRRVSVSRALIAAVALGTALPLGMGPAAMAEPPPAAAAAATHQPQVTEVTLVTGDRVRLATSAGGRQSVTVLPDATGVVPLTRVARNRGHVHVLPAAAAPLVASGRLDPRLFDVTQLVADGYGDDRSGVVPLIVASGASPLAADGRSTAEAAPPRALAGSSVSRAVPGLGISAVEVPKSDARTFWRSLTGAAPDDAARTLSAGLGKVWLDGRVRANLDRSVPQIGGPAARARGLDGRGTTVAVLDTGIDDQHPDVAAKVTAQADFVEEGDTDDHFGHGTHVASILAGSGARSEGKFEGVAPGAGLLDGKVLDRSGFGSDSSVLAGMEWAAGQGADVISMSLGAGPTDGTDPMSLAVDALTAQHGSLFVISAGNDYDEGSVSTPGTAESALTVGAVDREDAVADFSSKGPVLNGSRIKPEITAPGVDIVAAQADGTQLGDVVAPGYVALSGTSMAAPHVSGAVALLKQQHPAWSAAQLKAGLVATAKPTADTPVWHQGAGRVDLAPATSPGVRADAGTLDFGFLTYPHGGDAPVTKRLTYTNDTEAAQTVRLSATLADDEGTAAPAGALTLAADGFTLAPGATRAVDVTLTPDPVAIGRWSGTVTAVSDAGTTRTVVSLVKEKEKYDVQLRMLNRQGGATDAYIDVLDLQTGELTWAVSGETLRLAPGSYSLNGADVGTADEISMVQRHEFEVTKAATVTLDARGSVPYRANVPDPEARTHFQTLGYNRAGEAFNLTSTWLVGGPVTLYAKPTGTPRIGTFLLTTSTEKRPDELTARVVTGAPLALSPFRLTGDDRLDGRRVVTVGTASAPSSLAGGETWALIETPGGPADDAVAAAAGAGAKGAILWSAAEGGTWVEQDPSIPVFGLPAAEGQALADRVAAGTTRVEVVGTFYPADTYALAQPALPRIPRSLTYDYTPANLAAVRRVFRDHGAGGTGSSFTVPVQELGGGASGVGFRAGGRRTDWLSTDTPWFTQVEAFLTVREIDGFRYREGRAGWESPELTYRPGRSVPEEWVTQLSRPAAPAGYTGAIFPVRQGDEVFGYLSPWTDAQNRVSLFFQDDQASWTLASGGSTVAEGTDPEVLATLPAGRASYTLSVRAERPALDGLALSPRSDTRWTFPSARVTGDEPAALPLLSLDAPLPLDRHNSAAAGSATRFDVTGRLGAGAADVRSLAVDSSADGGRTWTRATVTRVDGDTFRVEVRNPAAAGAVSLRFAARATGGVAVDQTVIGAYAVR